MVGSWTAGAAGLSSPEFVELSRIHVISSERGALGPLSPLTDGLVNLGAKVDSALVEETVVGYALAVCLLHCMSQGCWALGSIAFFTNMVSRASVVCLCTTTEQLPADCLVYRLSHAYSPYTLVPSTAQPGPLPECVLLWLSNFTSCTLTVFDLMLKIQYHVALVSGSLLSL